MSSSSPSLSFGLAPPSPPGSAHYSPQSSNPGGVCSTVVGPPSGKSSRRPPQNISALASPSSSTSSDTFPTFHNRPSDADRFTPLNDHPRQDQAQRLDQDEELDSAEESADEGFVPQQAYQANYQVAFGGGYDYDHVVGHESQEEDDDDDDDEEEEDEEEGEEYYQDQSVGYPASDAMIGISQPFSPYMQQQPIGTPYPYLSDDADDEPGGVQLLGHLGVPTNYAEIAQMVANADVDVDSSSDDDADEDSDEDHDEVVMAPIHLGGPVVTSSDATTLPSLGEALGEYMHAAYPAGVNGGVPPPNDAAADDADQPTTAATVPTAWELSLLTGNHHTPGGTFHVVDLGDPAAVSQLFNNLTNGLGGGGGGGAWVPSLLAPTNLALDAFVLRWARLGRIPRGMSKGRFPWIDRVRTQFGAQSEPPKRIKYDQLEGDARDMQGVNWADLGVTRREARERRLITYQNFTHTENADRWDESFPEALLPRGESFFRFKQMDIRRNTFLGHFQLRNLMACTSRTQVFYTGRGVVHHFNPLNGQSRVALNSADHQDVPVSTIDGAHGVLVSGRFNGEYAVRRLDDQEDDGRPAMYVGSLMSGAPAITNHVQIQLPRRSTTPQACFASNDCGLRLVDLETGKVTSETMFSFPINCTAVSPDGQLRVMVGDHEDVLVVPADGDRINIRGKAYGDAAAGSTTGVRPRVKDYVEQSLRGHRDHGFACAWADDGWTVATGFQDRVVTVWDARNWRSPVASIRTEMAGVRSLRFSPAGSGRRVLVAAEEADFVNIIDARTFRSKQTIDIFGEIGGVAFEPVEGRDLFVFCPDPARGGILQLERCGEMSALGDDLMQYRRRPPGSAASGGGGGGGGGQDRYGGGYFGDDGDRRYHGAMMGDHARWQPSPQCPHGLFRCREHRYGGWDGGYAAYPSPLPSYDWPQENMSNATRRARRAQARRRHREAALADLDDL